MTSQSDVTDQLKISVREVQTGLSAIGRYTRETLNTRLRSRGGKPDADGWVFEVFNQQVRLACSPDLHFTGSPTLAVQQALVTYLRAGADSTEPFCDFDSDNWVTLRELSGGNPLFATFTGNIAKTIEQAYSGRVDQLQSRCLDLGGTRLTDTGYDLTVRFQALPCMPMILKFNDLDDLMPAQAAFLFREGAGRLLDLTGHGILCTYLAGLLINTSFSAQQTGQ